MTSRTVRFQPYQDTDGNYEPLLDFVRLHAPLLEPGFDAPQETTGSWDHGEQYTSHKYGWQYGTERGIKLSFNEEYEERAMGTAVSGVAVETFGLPEANHLGIRCERNWHDPRYIEMQVEGPEEAVETIEAHFRQQFGTEPAPTEDQLRMQEASAEVSIRVGAWQAAEMQARSVLSRKPDSVTALFCLGVALAVQRNLDEAEAYLRRAVELDPTHYDALYNLGQVCIDRQEYEKAVEQFRKALKIAPDNHPAHYKIGVALEKAGKREEAVAAYKEAVRTAPNPGQVFHYTGMDFEEKANEALERLGAS